MMTRGRKSLPPEEKARRGRKPGHDIAGNLILPTPKAEGDPIKPDGMPEAASALWDERVPRLVQMGIVGEADSDSLAAMFRCYAQFQKWMRKAERSPDPKYRTAALQYLDRYNKMAACFGMTPSDRARIPLKPKKEESTNPYKLVS